MLDKLVNFSQSENPYLYDGEKKTVPASGIALRINILSVQTF